MKKKIFNKISIILLCLLCLNTVIPIAAVKETSEEEYPNDVYTACLEEGMNVDAKSALLIEQYCMKRIQTKNLHQHLLQR